MWLALALVNVLVSADESRIAFGTTVCPADTVDLAACETEIDPEALEGFSAVTLKTTGKRRGRIGTLRLRLGREGDLEVRLDSRTIGWVHVDDTTLRAAGVTDDGNVVVALRDGRVVLVRDEGWIGYSDETDSHAWRVLVSADESQIAVESVGESVMHGRQEVSSICAAATGDCEHYAIAVPEGGSDPGARERYGEAVNAGGFRRIHLREVDGDSGRIGRLRVRVADGTITVKRGKKTLATQVVTDAGTMSGLGMTPGGDLVVVFGGWRAEVVALP